MGLPIKGQFAALAVLAIAYFALGTGSLAVVGLLEPMSATWGVRTTDVAQLVTVFALTFAVAAPGFQVIFSSWSRRSLLLLGLGVTGVGAIGAALAPTLGWAIAARVVMALGGAAVGPMASALAAHMVPPREQVRALSFVFGGLIFSTVLGVPIATWAGHALGWQGVFVTLGLLSLACIPAAVRLIDDRSAATPIRVGALFGVLRDPATAWSIVTTLLQIGGQFVTYTLITLVLTERYALPLSLVSAALLVFGIAGVSGNWLGGRWGDRASPLKIVWIAVSGLTAVFVLMTLVPHNAAVGLVLFGAWGILAMLFQAPQQKRLIGLAPGMGGLVLALNSSATYVGVSIGSYTSTHAWRAWGTTSLPVVSAVFLAGAAAALFFSQRAPQRLGDAAG